MERFYLCPVCKNYVSHAANETCEPCLTNPVPIQRLKSKDVSIVRTSDTTEANSPASKEKRSPFSLLTILFAASFCLAVYNAYRSGGEIAALKAGIIIVALPCIFYAMGRLCVGDSKDKDFVDLAVIGLCISLFIGAIPFFILKMLGVVDSNDHCARESYFTDTCTPDPSLPSFRWMD